MSRHQSNIIIAVLICFVAAAALAPVDNDQAMQQATYCEMVKTYKDTNGQFGWPDFRGNAQEVCK